MKQLNLEELQKKWSEGGKKGGSTKGESKKRSAEHYRQAGIKSGEARRKKRELLRDILDVNEDGWPNRMVKNYKISSST